MKSLFPRLLATLLFVASTTLIYAQEDDTVWQKLKSYFNPPAKYAGELGKYRSPLKFYDGRLVKTPIDWKKRRQEIIDRWHEMMGPWPELITKPKVEIIETTRRENFTQYRIRFGWRRDEDTEGYMLVPDRKGKKPAVVSVFYEPETAIGLNKSYGDFALQLVRRGFIALSIGTDFKTSARPYAQYYPNPDKAIVQPLSMHAYLAANAWNMLANWPEVDSTRIGIVGHSYGSKWAMFASCLYEKFACAAWSDGGIVFDESRPNVNYWEPWYLGYYQPPWEQEGPSDIRYPAKGLYPKLVKEGYDLHELHALMAPRPFLVSGGSEDPPERWIPLNHTVEVNKLLGFENRVGMTNRRDHTPTAESNEILCLFFEYFLKYKTTAQTGKYEQLAFNYFFDSLFIQEYKNVKVVEFNCVTETELTSFRSYKDCFQNENELRIQLAERSFNKSFAQKPISLIQKSKVRFNKIKIKSKKRPKLFIFLANQLNNKIYVLLELYKKYNYTHSYMFELEENGNIIRWCKTGVIH